MIGWAVGMIILLPTIAVLGYVGRLYFGTNIKGCAVYACNCNDNSLVHRRTYDGSCSRVYNHYR